MAKSQVGEGTRFNYNATIELIHPSFNNQSLLKDNNEGYTHLNILSFRCGMSYLIWELTDRSA